jgi:hypothetical protein
MTNCESELIDLVCRLIEAENKGGKEGRAEAEWILAENFTRITRARNEEQNRSGLLGEIETRPNVNLRREVERREHEGERSEDDADMIWVRCSGDLGVVRSIVLLTDRRSPQADPGKFRNTHVFERQEGRWWCVAWQVTKLA